MPTFIIPAVEVDLGLGDEAPDGGLVAGHAGDHERGPALAVAGVHVDTLHVAQDVNNLGPAPGKFNIILSKNSILYFIILILSISADCTLGIIGLTSMIT